MKSPVQLYLRVRLPDGTHPYLKAAFAANGRLRPHHAIHSGRATEFPGASYHLRYRAGEKRVWESVGNEPSLALNRLHQKVNDLRRQDDDAVSPIVAHAPVPAPPATEQPPLLLNGAIREYLTETKTHKSAKTFDAYRTTLYLFSPDAAEDTQSDGAPVTVSRRKAKKPAAKITRQFANKPLDEISRKDLLDHAKFLKDERGSVPRTIRNRIDFFQIFLHHYGLPSLLKGKDLPTYTEKKVRAYNRGQLATLFAEATQDEVDLLHFFLCTGAREQEVQFVCWTDVDLELKTYTVTEHLDLGYRPKDKEEGSLPIPDILVDILRARRVAVRRS